MKKVISTTNAPAAIGPYSQAIEANGFVFASGQIQVNPETGEIPEGIEAQAEQVMKNVKNLLEAAGTCRAVFCEIFCIDAVDRCEIIHVFDEYACFYNLVNRCPCVEVARLPKDVLLEMEAIAIK